MTLGRQQCRSRLRAAMPPASRLNVCVVMVLIVASGCVCVCVRACWGAGWQALSGGRNKWGLSTIVLCLSLQQGLNAVAALLRASGSRWWQGSRLQELEVIGEGRVASSNMGNASSCCDSSYQPSGLTGGIRRPGTAPAAATIKQPEHTGEGKRATILAVATKEANSQAIPACAMLWGMHDAVSLAGPSWLHDVYVLATCTTC